MIQLIKKDDIPNKDESIFMSELRPMEVGVIINQSGCNYVGDIVMRTQITGHIEIMNLTRPRADNCWNFSHGSHNGFYVRRLRDGEEYILKLTKD